MFSLKKPSRETALALIEAGKTTDFSYADAGATAAAAPVGYRVDHERFALGRGEADFLKAKQALRQWAQFDMGWVEVFPRETPIEVGAVVSIFGWSLGLWTLNTCKIVYVVDERGPVQRFGFAYGTLPGHVEEGEERFLVEWDTTSDAVTYELYVFSKAAHPLAKLGGVWIRYLQGRFRSESAQALKRAMS